MTTARENLFESAFKVYNTVLEINLRPKPLFSGDSESSCVERKDDDNKSNLYSAIRH